MPGPRPMASTVQLIVKCDFNGKEAINTFYFKYASVIPPTVTDLENLLDSWILNNLNAYRACVSSDLRVIELIATDLGHIPQISASRLVAPPNTGTRAGNVAPGNVSVGIKRKSAIRGRSYRGRIELPAPVGGDIVRDIIQSGLQALLTTLAGKLLDQLGAIGGGNFIPSVGSYKLVDSNRIVAWVFDLVSDSQQTRLLNHGD